MTVGSPRRLFAQFFRIGLFTFGGGMAMIPLIRHQLVERDSLVDDGQFVEAIAVAQCAPGPIAGNLAVLLGHRIAGWRGAAAALLGVALPAFLVLVVIAWQFRAWRDQLWAAKLFAGLRPAVIVLIAFAAFRLGRMTLHDRYSWAIYLAATLGLVAFGLHPLAIILAATALSFIQPWLPPAWRYTGPVTGGERNGPTD